MCFLFILLTGRRNSHTVKKMTNKKQKSEMFQQAIPEYVAKTEEWDIHSNKAQEIHKDIYIMLVDEGGTESFPFPFLSYPFPALKLLLNNLSWNFETFPTFSLQYNLSHKFKTFPTTL